MSEILIPLAYQLSVSRVDGFNSRIRCQEDKQTHSRLIDPPSHSNPVRPKNADAFRMQAYLRNIFTGKFLFKFWSGYQSKF